jgi:hypothetical protein
MFVRLKIRACFLFLASLALVLPACSGGNQAGSTPQIVAQTVVVTQVVTQVVPPTDTPVSVITPHPTVTPATTAQPMILSAHLLPTPGLCGFTSASWG